MSNAKQVVQATNDLHRLIEETTRLADERAKENRLKEQELSLKQEELNQHQIELDQRQQVLDQETRRLETERQANIKRDRVNADLMQRYINAMDLLVTIDGNFGETVQINQEDIRDLRREVQDLTQTVLALLARSIADMNESKTALQIWDNRATWRDQLRQHEENLQYLEQQAAGYGSLDVPVKKMNEIRREQKAIEDLRIKLGVE